MAAGAGTHAGQVGLEGVGTAHEHAAPLRESLQAAPWARSLLRMARERLNIDHRAMGLGAGDVLKLLLDTDYLRSEFAADEYARSCMQAAIIEASREPGARPALRCADGEVRIRGARALSQVIVLFNTLYQEDVDRSRELEAAEDEWKELFSGVDRFNQGKYDLPGRQLIGGTPTLMLKRPLKDWAAATEGKADYKREGLTSEQLLEFLEANGISFQGAPSRSEALELMEEAIREHPEEARAQEGGSKNLVGRRIDGSQQYRICSTESIKRVLRRFNVAINDKYPNKIQDVAASDPLEPGDDEGDAALDHSDPHHPLAAAGASAAAATEDTVPRKEHEAVVKELETKIQTLEQQLKEAQAKAGGSCCTLA